MHFKSNPLGRDFFRLGVSLALRFDMALVSPFILLLD